MDYTTSRRRFGATSSTLLFARGLIPSLAVLLSGCVTNKDFGELEEGTMAASGGSESSDGQTGGQADGQGDTADADEQIDLMAASICASFFDCDCLSFGSSPYARTEAGVLLSGTTYESCVEILGQNYKDGRLSGGGAELELDLDCFATRRDAYAAADCSVFDEVSQSAWRETTSCWPWLGTQPLGAGCSEVGVAGPNSVYGDCEPGLFCIDGTCVEALPGLGEACDFDATDWCAQGSYCHQDSGLCVPYEPAGASCADQAVAWAMCGPQAYCRAEDEICVLRGQSDAPCSEFYDCASGICREDDTCAPLAPTVCNGRP